LLLGASVAPTPRLDLGFLDSVHLKEVIEVLLFAPPAVVVVIADFSAIELADGGITPLGQLHAEAGDLAAEQSVRALDGRGQSEAIAGSSDRCGVSDLRSDFDNVAHTDLLSQKYSRNDKRLESTTAKWAFRGS
jgi:hypothetical protein